MLLDIDLLLPKTITMPSILPTDCYVWTGERTNGYGRIRIASRRWRVHIYAYEGLIGPIPPGLQLDHMCRVRACWNPLHLEPVTQQENIRRGNAGKNPKSYHNTSKTYCSHGHAFDKENTYVDPLGYRQCRKCRRNRMRELRK